MRVNLMIEGQENVSWNAWVALARACEDHGLDGLFRSDHYGSVTSDEPRASLDAWTTLAALAATTTRVRLGTLVSPVTFRHPSVLAKAAATVDHVSAGRVELGIGAGWNEPEHISYGFDLPSNDVRMEMLEEQIEIVHRQWTEESFSFSGRHYSMRDCRALPKPLQRPHPPLIVGGAAGPRSARLAARWADEYNTTSAGADECRERRRRVEREWEREGRDPASLRFSLMARVVVGASREDVAARARRLMARAGEAGDPQQWLQRFERRWVIGTPEQVLERLEELSASGVDRIMLQHLLHDDIETVELLGREVSARLGRPASERLDPRAPVRAHPSRHGEGVQPSA